MSHGADVCDEEVIVNLSKKVVLERKGLFVKDTLRRSNRGNRLIYPKGLGADSHCNIIVCGLHWQDRPIATKVVGAPRALYKNISLTAEFRGLCNRVFERCQGRNAEGKESTP
jgi:hypothetical protein